MENNLEIHNLTKSYDGFTLDHVSFSLPKGAIMGLIGANGAGKSTTMKLLLDIIRRDSGEITLFGQENTKVDLKQDVGVVFDESNFPEALTVDKIETIMRHIYRNWDSKEFNRNLRRFHLPKTKKAIKEFSRGMKMKLSLAVALSHHAKLLLLDEPTSGLDPIVRNEILDIFLEYIEDEECSILLSSHITTDLEKIADYITFINRGKIVLSESKDDLIYNYGVLKGGKEDLRRMNKAGLIGLRENAYGFEALVADKEAAARKYPNAVIDAAGLEDIMLFVVEDAKHHAEQGR